MQVRPHQHAHHLPLLIPVHHEHAKNIAFSYVINEQRAASSLPDPSKTPRHWSLVTRHWSLVTGHLSLFTRHWSLFTSH
ncbi:MAG: hypothetical protein DCC58_10170 [Chloroflexi bacterium]|nr:MAG: hypothetical protein DCC58_10170 [Chloroflexota bacterium]